MKKSNKFKNENIKIYSFYWDNIDLRLVDAQRKVFESFGFKIEQHHRHGMDHGLWIEEVLNSAEENEIIIIVDIDCIPLNLEAVQKAIAIADNGGIFGCAQSANHIDYRYIYAAPMFCAIKAKTWQSLGCPSLQADENFDVGGRMTSIAAQKGINIEMAYPSHSAVPKWLLGDKYIYGLFTIYNNSFLHLFESRKKYLIDCFVDLSIEIVSGIEPIDYKKYIIRAADESHKIYALKYYMKKSIRGKIIREYFRLKKRITNW
ncbi:hypothetical protein ACFFL1_12725 [Samsonia erythrinae]|uniref:Glycosyl transferase family 2 n=1 Tax=Samsonia erythrinae TaxID=160434 RepID=A0A4R3VB59_9GAMM|nr:hypothetical protein [Samsonia erythrinae]TCV02497.1 hypothetical protein EDC54_1163 [Samsonia erythrinae]